MSDASDLDKELVAINAIIRAIEPLDEFETDRAIEYIADRFMSSSKWAREDILTRLMYQINKIDNQGIHDKI